MKWRCTLIQRRLPDYPDGDLSPFWKRQVASHLKVCPDCRQEAAELSGVLSLYQSVPLPDPGPAFWQDFQQELHLKLAQVNQTPEPLPRRLQLPHYLLGATAMAGILALAVYLGPFSRSASPPQLAQSQGEAQAPALAQGGEPQRAKKALMAAPAPPAWRAPQPIALAPAEKAEKTEAALGRVAQPAPAPAQEPAISLAAGQAEVPRKAANGQEALSADDDDLDWDVDSVVADLSREERQSLKSKLESRR
jgi:hypothetical protein